MGSFLLLQVINSSFNWLSVKRMFISSGFFRATFGGTRLSFRLSSTRSEAWGWVELVSGQVYLTTGC